MRIFSDCLDAAKEIERDLAEMGKELVGYVYRISNPKLTLDKWIDYYKLNKEWIEAELRERISELELNPGESWKLRKEELGPLMSSNGRFPYTYSERFSYQLDDVLRELEVRPKTRQAVITIYEGSKDSRRLGMKNKVPRSISYQLILSDVENDPTLSLIYTMMDCDYPTCFGYDVALAIEFLDFANNFLKTKPGFLQHQIGSLHAFA